MHKLFFYTCIGALFFCYSARAQQDAPFTYHMKNMLFYHPGFSGTEGITQITALYRNQWAGYQPTFDDGGAPITQFVSVTTPIYKLRSGFGAFIVNDTQGPQNNLQVQASFAYHLGIKNSKLSFGVRAGIFSQSFDTDLYRAINPEDPIIQELQGGSDSQVRPDMAVGVFFRSEKYYVGASVNHILKSEFNFGIDQVRNALENHAYLTIGYIYTVNFDVKLEPSLLIQTDLNEHSFAIGGLAYYKDQMWGGLTFRQSDDVNVLLGYNFLKDKSLSFGYSFGYVIQDQDAKEPTTHEVLVSYQLPVSPRSGKKIQRTPRFRH